MISAPDLPILRDIDYFWRLRRASRAVDLTATTDAFRDLLRLAPRAGDDGLPGFYARKLGRLLGRIATAEDTDGAACARMLRAIADADPALFVTRYSAFHPWVRRVDWPDALAARVHEAALARIADPRAPFGTLFAPTLAARAALLEGHLRRLGLPTTLIPGREPPVAPAEGDPARDEVPLRFAPADTAITDGPLVTIVMTCFEAIGTIGAAVRSVLDQSWRRLELIIVDDASGDGTWEVVRGLAQSDQRIRALRLGENGGTYRAKNIGLRLARGEYVTFHDSDDVSHPRKIEEQMRLLTGAVAPAALSCWIRVDADGVCVPARTGRYLRRNYSSLLLPWSIVNRVGVFDAVTVSADSEYIDRLERVFGRGAIVQVERPLALGFIRASALTRSAETLQTEFVTSPVREAYERAYRAWHARTPRHALRLTYPTPERPFAAPDTIRSRATGDTVAERIEPDAAPAPGTPSVNPATPASA